MSRPHAVQQLTVGRGYLCAADVSSFRTLTDGVVVQVIYRPNNGRLSCSRRSVSGVYKDGCARLMEVHPFVSCSHVGEVWKPEPIHIPTDFVVAQEASDVESSSRLDFLVLHTLRGRFIA